MFQKSTGIRTLGNSHQWVFFLDDDVVLESATIDTLFTDYLSNPMFEDYVGFGLSISNRSTRAINSITLGILKLFNMYSNIPGTVTKSGHAQSYLDNLVDVEVQWLNGISVWKSNVLSQYPVILEKNIYSAYEDVNFSYNVSKAHKLLFAAKVKVINQKTEGGAPLTINQFVYGGYFRYKFVFANIELSKWQLLAAQLIRGVDFTFRPNKSSRIIDRLQASLGLWVNLLVLVLKNKNIHDLP